MKTGSQLREEAIKQVEENADALWVLQAESVVEFLAERRRYFTTDDVWDLLIESPREPRAMGAVMRRAQADGLITPTDKWQMTRRASSHSRPIRIWKSEL